MLLVVIRELTRAEVHLEFVHVSLEEESLLRVNILDLSMNKDLGFPCFDVDQVHLLKSRAHEEREVFLVEPWKWGKPILLSVCLDFVLSNDLVTGLPIRDNHSVVGVGGDKKVVCCVFYHSIQLLAHQNN